jgi:hypothetical protein
MRQESLNFSVLDEVELTHLQITAKLHESGNKTFTLHDMHNIKNNFFLNVLIIMVTNLLLGFWTMTTSVLFP